MSWAEDNGIDIDPFDDDDDSLLEEQLNALKSKLAQCKERLEVAIKGLELVRDLDFSKMLAEKSFRDTHAILAMKNAAKEALLKLGIKKHD